MISQKEKKMHKKVTVELEDKKWSCILTWGPTGHTCILKFDGVQVAQGTPKVCKDVLGEIAKLVDVASDHIDDVNKVAADRGLINTSAELYRERS